MDHLQNLSLRATILAISDEEMEDLMKIVNSLEGLGLKQLKMKKRNKKECYQEHQQLIYQEMH